MNSRRLQLLVWGVFVVASVTALWLQFNIAPGEEDDFSRSLIHRGDIAKYYAPMTELTAERLLAGDLPLWNPEACSGIPFLAELQAALFYPTTWLSLLLTPQQTLSVAAFLHCALAGLFAFALFRAWNATPAAAAIGGTLYVFTCALGQTFWPPAVATIAWMPWILLCVERLTRSPSIAWWAGLSLGTALQLLAGFPQYLIYSWILAAAIAGLRLIQRHGGRHPEVGEMLKGIGWLASAVALGVGIASVQLFPTLELLGQGLRAERLPPAQIHYLNLFEFPFSIQFMSAFFDPAPGHVIIGFAGNGYVGVVTLLMIAVGVASGVRKPLVWLLLATGSLALVLSDGYLGYGHTIYEQFARIPLLGNMRTPERLRLLTFFSMVALAVFGFSAVERAPGPGRHRATLTAVAGIAAPLIGWGVVASGNAIHLWRLGLGLMGVLALLHLGAWRRARVAVVAGLALLVTADVTLAIRPDAGFLSLPTYGTKHYRWAQWAMPPGVLKKNRDRVGSDRLAMRRFEPLIGAGPTRGVRRVGCYEPLVPGGWAALHREIHGKRSIGITLTDVDPEAFPAFFDVTSARRIAMAPRRVGRRYVPHVLDNPDALPRAFWIGRHRPATREEAIAHIAKGDVDFRSVVLLTEPPAAPQARDDHPLVRAQFIEDNPERIELAVEAPDAGWLVLTDTHYPGWSAAVDGAPAEIILANGLHRAVHVSQGAHEILFEFKPKSLRQGAGVSAISLLLLAIIVWARTTVSRSTKAS